MEERKTKDQPHQVFINGRFNHRWPRGYNYCVGLSDAIKNNSSKYISDIDVPLVPSIST